MGITEPKWESLNKEENAMKRKPRNPWVILAVCCGLATSSIGISINTSGVFYSAVCDDLHLGRGEFSMHMTIFSLVTAFFSLVVPTLLDRFPFKPLLTISVAIAVVSTGLMACGSSVLPFYLLGAVRGASTCVFSSLCLTTILNRWFYAKNGLVTSLVFGCTGLSGAVFSPVFSACISAFGWRISYLIVAALLLLFTLPAIVYPFHLDPAKDGMVPYGADRQVERISAPKGTSFRFFSVPFLTLCLFSFLVSALTSFTQYFPAYAQSLGIAATVSSVLISCGMIGNIVSKLSIGVISDQAGKVPGVVTMLIANAVGLILILIGRSIAILSCGAVLFGACYSISAVGLPLLTRHFFGLESYGQAFPVITLVANVGSAISLPVVGSIYDATGSYQSAFFLACAMSVICFLSLILCWGKKKLREK